VLHIYIYDISRLRVKVLIIITICKKNDNEILLNFNAIYLILGHTLYSFLKNENKITYISCDLRMA